MAPRPGRSTAAICGDPALERRFQPVQVEPPTPEQALGILKALRPAMNATTACSLRMKPLRGGAAVGRYLPDRQPAGKAIDLMDEAARVASGGGREPPSCGAWREEHHAAETALRQAVEQEQFEAGRSAPGSGELC